MISATFNPNDQQAILQSAFTAIEEAKGIVIDSNLMYEEAGGTLAVIKGSIKKIEDAKESLLKPVREVDRAIRALFDPALAVRKEAETTVKRAMLTYTAEQERQAQEARRQAEEVARRERERLEAQAAAERAKADQEAADKRRKAEEADRQQQVAITAGNAKEAARAAAAAAKAREEADAKEAAGMRQQAELSERAQLVSVQAETVEVAKFKGASVRKKWKAKVTDKVKLVAFIGQNPQFLNLLEVDESALNKMAGAMEKNLESTLPGIEVYQEAIMGSRSA